MIRATRGMWRSPRQLLRASKAKKGSATGGRRSVCDLAKQESAHQKHAFGRTTIDAVRMFVVHDGRDWQSVDLVHLAELIPKALAVGAVDALDFGAMDALMISLKDLAEDDDGR